MSDSLAAVGGEASILDDATLERFADLAVSFGANDQPGKPPHAMLTRRYCTRVMPSRPAT